MLPALESPELVLGICSPIGTDNVKVTDRLARILASYGYTPVTFKVTNLMKSVNLKGSDLVEAPIEKRYDSYIRYANDIRRLYDDPSALAVLCCAAIRNYRRKKQKRADTYLPRHAYILDQFKRKEEIEALRQVYGKSFLGISIYSDKEGRVRRIAQKIADGRSAARLDSDHEKLAIELIKRDEDEVEDRFGQRLSGAFPLADVFVDVDDISEAENVLSRFFKGFFGANDVSPTRDEYGMYIAKSASLRSLDLSRQVGAAIFSPDGEVIALGCNEVPKAGGGTYWNDDSPDGRDFNIGRDENERIKRALLIDVVRRIFRQYAKREEIVSYVMAEMVKSGSSVRDALVMDLLEFGRIIHAEMSAICDCSRIGRSVKGATLYCTTFPCHICAKHIIASGIKKVVFIEPYPKSYAEQLHGDSMIVQTGKYFGDRIQFAPFVGVAPARFREVFERLRRKDQHGHFIEWSEGKPRPIVKHTIATYLKTEAAITNLFDRSTKALIKEKKIEVGKSSA